MSDWQEVPQGKTARVGGPRLAVSMPQKGAPLRLVVTVPPAVLEALGWQAKDLLTLDVGRGSLAGWVRVRPSDVGRPLRRLGRAPSLQVQLDMGPLRTAGVVPPTDAPEWRREGGVLVLRLPFPHQLAPRDGDLQPVPAPSAPAGQGKPFRLGEARA